MVKSVSTGCIKKVSLVLIWAQPPQEEATPTRGRILASLCRRKSRYTKHSEDVHNVK